MEVVIDVDREETTRMTTLYGRLLQRVGHRAGNIGWINFPWMKEAHSGLWLPDSTTL